MFTDEKSLEVLKAGIKQFPEVVVVLGSGWNKVLDGVEVESEIPYKDLFGVEASVPGHEGKLVVAKVGDKRVAFLAGRVHMYEGYSAKEATLPVRVFANVGVKKLVLTAACGALNKDYRVGDFVLLNDLVTLFLALDNPLVGPKFLDMSQVFDKDMRRAAKKVLVKNKISFQEGSYCYYHGPNYETPADKRALAILGADVVGMSTVPETLVAKWLGVEVLGLAFVTNLAFVKHDHREVVAQAEKASKEMVVLLEGVLERFS